MIRILTGDFGSGKSEAIAAAIRRDVEAGKRAYLLVPEQGTLFSEQQMADLLPPSAPLCFEVTNFSRLANTVFRREGGLSYHYATSDVRTLIMWRTMGELLPLLHEKQGEQELGRVRKMSAAMAELSALSLTPAALSAAAKKLPQGERLREKLEDLSLLSALYHSFLREQYDDMTEDLDHLAELLLETRFLSGAHLYVDGFISFTEQQWRILRAAAATCDMTVTLTLPAAREDDLTFEETRDTYARLLRMAERAGVSLTREDLGENKRTDSPVLLALLPQLFGREKPNVKRGVCCKDGKNEAVRLVSAPDAFYACAYIAADIARRVKDEGAQYRDFAVIAHSADAYAGILDVCMQDADVPCFMSKKTDIDAYAAVKLLYTAYAICTGGWRREDVISYLKCGMSGISEEDIDLFEIYVTRWNLYGRRFTDEVGWNMNPDGYTDRLTPRGEEVLRRVEGVRRTLLEQLAPLTDRPSRSGVTEHCRALYDFMCRLEVEKQLSARAEEARVLQNTEEADILSRLFVVLCDALDRLCDTLGDTEVGNEQFLDLLRLMLSEQELSRIPSAIDQVTVGSADLLRTAGARHVYLLGVNEGEFPAAARSGGVFSEGDRRVLSELGLSVEPNLTLYAARELFCLARAFATAKESVTLLSSDTTLSGSPQQPAAVFNRIKELTGLPIIRTTNLPVLDQLFRPHASADYLGILRGTVEGEALARVLSRDPRYAEAVVRLDTPLSDTDCRLNPATAKALYDKQISLTQSRIDRYVRCPFSYFCQYVLRLDAARVIEFDYSDAGNLLHTVLERFFDRLQKSGRQARALTPAEVENMSDEIIAEYVRAICPDSVRSTPRFLHLLSTLRRAALPVLLEMVEEFSQSDFVPTFFELGIADGEDAPEGLPFTLPNGTRVSLYGRVDRVDTYRKGDQTYLRVIDYKSGDKSFSLSDIERGLNTQLLVYMISMWKSENPAFRARLCGEGGEILPAGVLYTGARIKDATCDSPAEARELADHLGATVKRSGLLLNDPEILRAMDHELSGRYIPVKLDPKSGKFEKASLRSLASLEKMGELVGKIDEVICHIAGEMQRGHASARPRDEGKRNRACEYCDMRAVCRSVEL
ncbi:MAG: PD-(D/E)XK nuclease family protein [Clostridia bacterium]|nr:PD-(D/E)XK nuclease family protein [Clostridia bacterium]